jgi:hypothetical protein
LWFGVSVRLQLKGRCFGWMTTELWMVERIRFSVREPALFAPAAQGPAINADKVGKRSHRYTEKRGQLFQPFDWEAAEGYFHILQ